MKRSSWLRKHKSPHTRRELAKRHPLAFHLEYPIRLLIPGKGEVDFELYEFQQLVLRDNSQFRAVNKMRQGGMTTGLGYEAFWKLCHVPGTQIVVISKNTDAAVNFIEYVSKFYAAYSEQYPGLLPKLGKDNLKQLTVPSQKSWIKAVAADRRAGTSFTATDLYFDETAHSKYAESIYRSAMPTLSKSGGAATLFSSPEGRGNLHHRIHTQKEEYDFSLHQFEWWWVPDYNPSFDYFYRMFRKGDKEGVAAAIAKAKQGAWYKTWRPRFSQRDWDAEYECSFDAGEGNAFSDSQLKNFFHGRPLEVLADPDGVCSMYYSVPPKEGHTYAQGIDLGRKRDATVSWTYDITDFPNTPAELVDFRYMTGMSSGWDVIVAELAKVYERYKPYSRHDATGLGDVVSGGLPWSEPYVISANQNSGKKLGLINNLQRAMDEKLIQAPRIKQAVLEHERYQFADRGLQTDTVLANALAVSLFYEPSGVFSGYVSEYSYV